MKKHNLFKVVGIAILVTVLLTWVLPTTYFQYELTSGDRSQVGIFDLLSYPTVVLSYFGNIVIYLLAIGGFYGILHKIGAYRSLLDNIAKKAKGKEKIILSCIMILLAIFTSVCGASLGVWVVVPFIISLVLLMGYDKITAAMVTIGSIAVGMIGTTLSSTYVTDASGMGSQISAQNGMGVVNTMLDVAVFKALTVKQILLIAVVLSFIYVVFAYIKKKKSICALVLSILSSVFCFIKIFFIDIGFNSLPFQSMLLKVLFTVLIVLGFIALLIAISLVYIKKQNKILIIALTIITYFLNIKYMMKFISIDVFKVLTLAVGLILLVFNVLRYASNNKSTKKVSEDELLPVVGDKKSKSWPIVLIMDLVFIITLLSLTSWTSVFKLKWFSDATTAVLTKFQIFKFPILGKLFGTIAPFEQWSVTEISSLLVIASIVLAIIYKVKLSEYLEDAFAGIKKALKPAILVVGIYIVLVIVSYNPIVLTILKPLLGKTLNAFTMCLSAFIASIFNVDLYYAASSVLQYASGLYTSGHSAIAFIWQTMYGFASLIAPTSIILMSILSYLDIPYGKWVKSNWKFILEILACCLIISTIIVVRL